MWYFEWKRNSVLVNFPPESLVEHESNIDDPVARLEGQIRLYHVHEMVEKNAFVSTSCVRRSSRGSKIALGFLVLKFFLMNRQMFEMM